MYRALWALISLTLLTACAPITVVDKIGNEYVQNAYSRQFWWPNWQRVTYCWKLDANGFCPKDDTRQEVETQIGMAAAGNQAAVGFVSNSPLGLGLGLGLAHSGSTTNQNASASQSNSNQYGPYRGHYRH